MERLFLPLGFPVHSGMEQKKAGMLARLLLKFYLLIVAIVILYLGEGQ